MANGMVAKDVAATQSAQWLQKQTTGAVAKARAGTIRDAAIENQGITKTLLPDSINPASLALLAGANQIRSGSSKGAQAAQESLSSFEKGKGSNDSWEEFKKNNDVVEVYLHTTDIRGREEFFVPNYELPLENFIDLDSTGLTVEELFNNLMIKLKGNIY